MIVIGSKRLHLDKLMVIQSWPNPPACLILNSTRRYQYALSRAGVLVALDIYLGA